MEISIELTEAEAIYLSENCIRRVVNSALDAVSDDYEHRQDLIDLGDFMEPLRFKLCNAIFRAKTERK